MAKQSRLDWFLVPDGQRGTNILPQHLNGVAAPHHGAGLTLGIGGGGVHCMGGPVTASVGPAAAGASGSLQHRSQARDSSLPLETYLTLHGALTRGHSDNQVCKVSPAEESFYRLSELKQVGH